MGGPACSAPLLAQPFTTELELQYLLLVFVSIIVYSLIIELSLCGGAKPVIRKLFLPFNWNYSVALCLFPVRY